LTPLELTTVLKEIIANNQQYTTWTVSTPHLIALVNKVVADEREACAKVCDSLEEQCEKLGMPDEKWPTPSDCASVIRARGQA
jgi:hypothetical protein